MWRRIWKFPYAKSCKIVYGVDIDQASIEHASQKYAGDDKNLSFLTGSTSAIPLEDEMIDLDVSFETIEHHDAHEEMMKEIKRVLKPDGILIISSPDKTNYRQLVPENPFHVKELMFPEFQNLLEKFFRNCSYYEQRFIAGSFITPVGKKVSELSIYDGDYYKMGNDLKPDGYFNKAYYNIAVSSDVEADQKMLSSFFNGAGVIMKKIVENRERGRREIMKSTSFKLGNWMVKKLSFLKRK